MNYCEKASTVEPPLAATHLQRPFFWQTVHTFALVSTCLHWPLSSAPKVTLVRWGSTECELFAIAFNPQRAPSVGGKTKCNKLEERTRVFCVIYLIVLGLIVVIERDALSLTLSLSSSHTVSFHWVMTSVFFTAALSICCRPLVNLSLFTSDPGLSATVNDQALTHLLTCCKKGC